MRVVLEASAALEVVLRRPKAAPLSGLLEDASEVLAPDLFVAEVVNTIWKYHQFEGLALNVCEQALEHTLGLVDALVSSADLWREAFLLARTARQPAYEMFYLALARRHDAALLTTDAALRKEGARQGIRVG